MDKWRSPDIWEEPGVKHLLLHVEWSQLRCFRDQVRMPSGQSDPGHALENISLNWLGDILVPPEELVEEARENNWIHCVGL